MDKITLMKMLNEQFGNHFEFHPKFYEEFCATVTNSGEEKDIIIKLINKLNSVIQLGDIDSGLKWLEKLKAYDNLYSLHIDTKNKNYRLLFSKINNNKFFLHLFDEKDDSSESSYAKHCKIALGRRDDI